MDIQSITLDKVSKIYLGRDRVCRCGCAGDYVTTTYTKGIRSYDNVDDKLAKRRLRQAQKHALEGAKVEYHDTYINVSYGNDRAITLYTDDL